MEKLIKHKSNLKNPFITENAYEVEKLGHDAFTFSRKSGQSYEEANEAASKAIRKKLENDGYDGIVLKQPAGQAEIVVFYPDKSVIKLLPPKKIFFRFLS